MSPQRLIVRDKEGASKLRRFTRRVLVKMLASPFVTFTIVFVSFAAPLLVIELTPWIARPGVTDIDPLPILMVSFIAAFAAVYARFLIMKRFSGIRP